ncbi:MAG: hypothetical protein J0M18_00285 [Ignavibacteria bacterium]|jgi:hypothetical protein|nr:hypothetical protein [Ignavibacteria bacterium]
MSYEKLLHNKIKEISGNDLRVYLFTHEEFIEKLPTVKSGALLTKNNSKEYTGFAIAIDGSESDDMKLRILFHEIGHLKFEKSIGYLEVQERKGLDESAWNIETEFYAFENELLESYQLAANGDKEFLINTIKKMEENYDNDYKDALKKIKHTELWDNCQKILA